MSYPCTSCGACCRRVGRIPDFPEPVRPDGSCVHLNANNQCDIYENRPTICQVDKMHELVYSFLPKEVFYKLNIALCNQMIEEDKLNPKYKIFYETKNQTERENF